MLCLTSKVLFSQSMSPSSSDVISELLMPRRAARRTMARSRFPFAVELSIAATIAAMSPSDKGGTGAGRTYLPWGTACLAFSVNPLLSANPRIERRVTSSLATPLTEWREERSFTYSSISRAETRPKPSNPRPRRNTRNLYEPAQYLACVDWASPLLERSFA